MNKKPTIDQMRLELMGKAKPKRMHMAEGGGIDEYQGGHKPPSESYGAPLHDLTQIYPDDIYSHKALNLYGMGHPEHKKMDMESLFKAQLYRNKPDSSVSIFRAVPQHIDKINPQDWVTLSPMYAKLHGESRLGGKYKILKKTVKAKDLWNAGDSIHEWGYHPEEEKKAKGGRIKGPQPLLPIETTVKLANRELPVTMDVWDKRAGRQIAHVNPQAFDKAFSKNNWQYVGPKGEGGIEGRYQRFADFAKEAPSVHASNADVSKTGAVTFGDGRHRYAYLRDQGVQKIPMSMDKQSIEHARQHGYLNEAKGGKVTHAHHLEIEERPL